MGVLKPMLLAYQIVEFYEWRMYNEACLDMPRAPKITIQQILRISVLEVLDPFNAVRNEMEVVK